MPGLAVDAAGNRAYVVPVEDRIAAVDLATLAVVGHELTQPATGSSYDSASDARSTIRLVAYGPDGARHYALFPDRYPWVSAAIDGRAYIGFGGDPDQTLAIVDLATGRIVATT